jgi:MOSC domain-containing protein YiiM
VLLVPSGHQISGGAACRSMMIEAEVCELFDPPLGPDEHRRNLVTRGINLNGLVGHEFAVGEVCCRGMRLCEPCTVVQGYASRPILGEPVHRGGIRVDILEDGEIKLDHQVRAIPSSRRGMRHDV